MKISRILFTTGVLAAALWRPVACLATPFETLDPVSDGSLYTCPICIVVHGDGDVVVSGYIQGDIKFSAAEIQGPVAQAILTVNPIALPLFGTNVDVYGFGSNTGSLDVSDANAGTLLGVLTLPVNLNFGQDAYFDVTSFVQANTSPYIGFNLRTTATDVFSSIEDNDGHPSQLDITYVPEPACWTIFAGFAVIGVVLRRRAVTS